MCGICKEKLETYFHDEDGEDEWRFRNAIRNDGQLYHYTCWKDAEKVGRLTPWRNQPCGSLSPLPVAVLLATRTVC